MPTYSDGPKRKPKTIGKSLWKMTKPVRRGGR